MYSSAHAPDPGDTGQALPPLEADEAVELAALFGRAERTAKEVLDALTGTTLGSRRVSFSWNAPFADEEEDGSLPGDQAGPSIGPHSGFVHVEGPWEHKAPQSQTPQNDQVGPSAHAWIAARAVWESQIPRVQQGIEPFLDALQSRLPLLHVPEGRLFFYVARHSKPSGSSSVGLRLLDTWVEKRLPNSHHRVIPARITVVDLLRLVERARHLPPASHRFRIPDSAGFHQNVRGATQEAAELLQRICAGEP